MWSQFHLLVVVALELLLCTERAAVSVGARSRGTEVEIGPHGRARILAEENPQNESLQSLQSTRPESNLATKGPQIIRGEKDLGQETEASTSRADRRSTTVERSKWASRHGNLAKTRLMLKRLKEHAFSRAPAIQSPSTVPSQGVAGHVTGAAEGGLAADATAAADDAVGAATDAANDIAQIVHIPGNVGGRGSVTRIWSSHLVFLWAIFILIGLCITCAICIIQLRYDRDGDGDVDERDMGIDMDGDGVIEDAGGTGTDSQTEPGVEKEDFKRLPEPLHEDLYGVGIAALVVDTQRIVANYEGKNLRMARCSLTVMMLIFCMGLQVFILAEMELLVTMASNKEAEETYEKYEIAMYGNDPANMDVIEGGWHRGRELNFNMANFGALPDTLKDAACQVPLSQPTFFIGLLLVWTLVCFSEMRHVFDLGGSLVASTPTIPSMAGAIEEREEEGLGTVNVVIGLTMYMKIIITVLILIPRVVVSAVLLFLGCRWLTGTFGFSDVLQNAVALQFVLMMKDFLYHAVIPDHNKKETRSTMIQPFNELDKPSFAVFMGSFAWGLVALGWVLAYITTFQQVLPDYQWDIHDVCVDFLLKKGNITETAPFQPLAAATAAHGGITGGAGAITGAAGGAISNAVPVPGVPLPR